jgi:hypothetical protein
VRKFSETLLYRRTQNLGTYEINRKSRISLQPAFTVLKWFAKYVLLSPIRKEAVALNNLQLTRRHHIFRITQATLMTWTKRVVLQLVHMS